MLVRDLACVRCHLNANSILRQFWEGWAFRNSVCVPNIRYVNHWIISYPFVICASFLVDKSVSPTELHYVVYQPSYLGPIEWEECKKRHSQIVTVTAALIAKATAEFAVLSFNICERHGSH